MFYLPAVQGDPWTHPSVWASNSRFGRPHGLTRSHPHHRDEGQRLETDDTAKRTPHRLLHGLHNGRILRSVQLTYGGARFVASRSEELGVGDRVEHPPRREGDIPRNASPRIDRHGEVHEAARRKRDAIVEDRGAHDAAPENVNAPGMHPSRLPYATRVQLGHVSIFQDADIGVSHAGFTCERGVPQEMVQRSVHRDERLGPDQLEHPPLLLAMRVAADVHGAVGPP